MKIKLAATLFLTLFACGCPVCCCFTSYSHIRNDSGQQVTVKIMQTNFEKTIPPGKSAKFAHSGGDIILTARDGTRYRYQGIRPISLDHSYRASGFKSTTAYFILDSQLQIRVVPPDSTTANFMQPEGYPMRGEEISD